MTSPTMGAWECRHGVDGRDKCEECLAGDVRLRSEIPQYLYTVTYRGEPIAAYGSGFEARRRVPAGQEGWRILSHLNGTTQQVWPEPFSGRVNQEAAA